MPEIVTLIKPDDPVVAWLHDEYRHSSKENLRIRACTLRPVLVGLAALDFDALSASAPALITEMLQGWLNEDVAKATIKNRLDNLRSFWRWSNRQVPDSVSAGCFEALRVPRVAKVKPVLALSIKQQQKLLIWAYGKKSKLFPAGHLYALISLGLYNGLRPSELVHLAWSEIVQNDGRWFVRIRDLAARAAKNPRAKTAIELNPVCLSALQDNFEWQTDGSIFPAAAKGRHRAHLQKIRADLAAPWFNLYALRRTCITNWYNTGLDTRCITDLARHSSDVITRKHYIQPAAFVGLDGFPL